MTRLSLLIFSMLILGACSGSDPEPASSPSILTTPAQDIAATINGEPVTIAELDAHIKLGLYDLEWEKYKLRQAGIQYLADRDGGELKVLLEPPKPPRLTISLGDRPLRGPEDAPVILSVFCSFQSSHCARLQPELERLMADNGDLIALAYFDFPQRFHRNGMAAANAARCAFEGGANWDFFDSLFGAYDDLTPRRFQLLARQSDLSPIAFKTCFDARRYDNDILDDINYAQALGFKNVPVVLINGLYVKGPKTAPTYQYYIDQELSRLGIEKTTESSAIESSEIETAGKEVPITQETPRERYVPKGLGYDRVRGVDDNMPLRDKSEVSLSRAWVTAQLRDEQSLVDYFYKAEHKASGHHMLKLSDVSGHEFFETMGFRTGDVIMKVNGEWVHDGQNSLWNDLRFTDGLEISLMRRGKPVTYYYKFKD